MKKVITILGTRPEIIRLSLIIKKIDKFFDHILIHTGQNYDYNLNDIFLDKLNIRKPDYFLGVKAKTLGEQVAKIIQMSENVFQKEKPDALLVLGDTNSSLASICAKRMKIPIFHMEAGNRCFDENVPEEINRKIVDHISDINLPYSENARFNLTREGIHSKTIYVTGSPMAEVFAKNKEKIENSNILLKLKIKKGEYFLASLHREENVDKKTSLQKLMQALEEVAKKYKKPVFLSTHPRTKKNLEKYKIKINQQIKLCQPFGYLDYMHLQKNAFCVLSDSGSILEESAILQFPAIQVRESSERPEGYDEGIVILTGLEKDIILKSIEIVTNQFNQGERFSCPRDYQSTNVSSKVLRLIVGLCKIVQEKRK